MRGLLAFGRAIDAMSAAAGKLADWLVLFACLISSGNAGVRYIFSYSSNAFLEIQWYLFGALVFLGASYTLQMNEHVRVDLVYSSVSDRTRPAIRGEPGTIQQCRRPDTVADQAYGADRLCSADASRGL
jgi:TRAP-type mannitol/chloroaromatic compound transport system permease small subunit